MYEINSLEDHNILVKRFLIEYFRTYSSSEEGVNYGSFGDSRAKRFVNYIYGYLCFYYFNASDGFKIVEKVKMDSLYGLKITPPFIDSSEFDVEVKPNEDYIVIFNTTAEGQIDHYYEYSSWCYLEPCCPDEVIKKEIESKPKKVVKRVLNGKEVDIFFYIFSFPGGYYFYYKNQTNYVYQEQLKIDLINLVGFDNNDQSNFEINLNPHKDFLLKFKAKNILLPFSFTTHVTYRIFSPNDQNVTPQYQNYSQSEIQQLPRSEFVPNNQPSQNYPKTVSDMLSHQIQSYQTNQSSANSSYPPKNQQASQPLPFQQMPSNQQKLDIPSDFLMRQIHAYGNNEAINPPFNSYHENDVINSQPGMYSNVQEYTEDQTEFHNFSNPSMQQQQMYPKPVKDLMAYQMQNYGTPPMADPSQNLAHQQNNYYNSQY